MPYFPGKQNIRVPIYDYCCEKAKLSRTLSDLIVRLVIASLHGRALGHGYLKSVDVAIHKFIDFLTARSDEPSELEITDISKDVWIDYLSQMESSPLRKAKEYFNSARMIFSAYPPTAHGGWLKAISFRTKRTYKPPSEQIIFQDYSDSIMYQILAVCLEGFQRRIGYLKHYKNLAVTDMPDDWLYPGRKNVRIYEPGRIFKNAPYSTESTELVSKWLQDENEGYDILLNHHILHHKMGAIKKYGGSNQRVQIQRTLNSLQHRRTRCFNPLEPLVQRFKETMAARHGFAYGRGPRQILSVYINKSSAKEPNQEINQIGWCLVNILMMNTGINKEVALSIPSRCTDGRSILDRSDSIFVSADGVAEETELYGFKQKTGNSPIKTIPIPIPRSSPIFAMLREYEQHAKVDFNGPFFEFNDSFIVSWSKAGGTVDFALNYPILDDNGDQLTSIDTTKFRKVFASGRLLDRMRNIESAQELAEQLRNDLRHENIDVTLSNYLFKTSVGQGVIDIAIATITSEKLEEGLKFRGQILTSANRTATRKVFLCDCEDPTNPTHGIAIAAECKHYDLCLGCERSVVTKIHLPYICARILQYEAERRRDPIIWPAIFEDRWMIARDTLDKYVAADQKTGAQLVNDAWTMAQNGSVSLPPIISGNRM